MVFQNDILAGASGATGGYTIDQSIRFNRDDSAYLTKTFSTDEGDTWTLSVWIKRGQITSGNNQYWFSEAGGSGIGFVTSTDTLRLYNGSTIYNSTPVFRDPSSWYHIVFSNNSGTWVCYVNGELVSGFTGTAANFNRNNAWSIGRYQAGADNYFDGYMADFYWIGDQALAATDFGEYNNDGVWVPKSYAGTYGTNGFYITGADSADLGADESGNSNNFTSSGLTTSSQVLDTPTDNYCVMNENVQNRDGNLTNSNGIRDANLQLYRPSASTNSFGSGTMAVYGGTGAPKLYYECYTSTYPGGNVLQMYIEDASSSENVSSSSFGLNQRHSTSAYRLFIYPGGNVTPGTWTSEFGQGVYVGLAVDFANDEISANVDGTEIFSYNATELAALTGITIDTFAGRWWRPKIQVANDAATIIDVNFGQNAFQNAPTDYVGWSTSAIPTPTIKDGSAYFQTTLYTGTGAALEINQTGNSTFQPDMVWAKSRSSAQSHRLADAIRGSAVLFPDLTNAEDTTAGISFDADGFSWTNTDGSNANDSGVTYAAWQWLAGNGTSANSDGDIASTVSANVDAGFSIVSWTLGSTDNQTVGHGLSSAPEFMFLKNRNTSGGWTTYHKDNTDQPETEYLRLDSSNATVDGAEPWNDTAPTSSVFTIGDASWFGSASDEMMMYCFRSIPGFSKAGTYTGNGSADGPFVQCNFRPAFILVKEYTSVDDWLIYDSVRDSYNVAGQVLRPDSSAAEFDGRGGSRDVDFLSNGFKFRSSNATMNGSGAGYIFMAFAEHPFGGNGVAPVPAR